MKTLTAIFRLGLYFFFTIYLGWEIFDPKTVNSFIADLYYGSHTSEMREMTSVKVTSFFYFGILSVYIMQTIFYLLIGSALEGKNTSLLRFFRLLISGIQEAASGGGSSSDNHDLSSLNKVMHYRDSKMAAMSNKDAVKFMRETSHIDQAMASSHLPQSRKVLGYVNNKVAFMSNERAINYLRGKED